MIAASRTLQARRSPQQGSFMLEALIAILIVALGILGTVGLYARSIQNVDDAKFRGEAALLANTLVGQMWVSDPRITALKANFDSGSGGPGYVEFAALVAQRLPNSTVPTVIVTQSVGPAATTSSSDVVITIQWKHPGDLLDVTPREFTLNATIGSNLLCPC
jgi:type IV pilus assembly protein PilV